MNTQLQIKDFFSHSIGLDSLLNQIHSFQRVNTSFPPYNLTKDGDKTLLTMALAGYNKDSIRVVVEDGVLSIKSSGENNKNTDLQVVDDSSNIEYYHKGIAKRSFTKSFSLGEFVKVQSAKMEDGMLIITLEEVLPPEKQPIVVDVV